MLTSLIHPRPLVTYINGDQSIQDRYIFDAEKGFHK
ncbi:hypothetical protein PPL19_01680 [Pseudomonas psychrotolerans L19]|nr:hypothetical protein PPL19_01680 [Pseudomonas psychrotolerans L19]